MSQFSIHISLQDTIDEFSLNPQQVIEIADEASKVLTLEVKRQWDEAAKRELNQTRDGYLRGLAIIDNSVGNKSILLTGKFNNMLEYGASPFDIKEGFMKSSKVKIGKNGWYLTIPFRLATPGANGFSSAFSGVMPQEIYDLVKGFSGNQTNLQTGNVVGNKTDRLGKDSIPAPYNELGKREKIAVTSKGENGFVNHYFEEYTHKSSIYEGMQRDEKYYKATAQSTYNTFRRVGATSDPLSWIHKGIKEYNLAQQALDNTDGETIVGNVVDKKLNEMGFGE